MMQMMICEIDGVAPGIWMQPIGYSVLREQSNSQRSKRNQKYLTNGSSSKTYTYLLPTSSRSCRYLESVLSVSINNRFLSFVWLVYALQ